MKNLILIFCLFVINIFPQRANPDMWVATAYSSPMDYVFTIAVDGNYTYIGGGFKFIGPNTGHGGKFTTASNLPNMSFPKVNGGVICCAVPDGSGGWYIGGEFSKVGTEFRNNIARINSDGTVNIWNPNVQGGIRTMFVSDSSIYIGGIFTSIGDQSRKNIAKLNKTTGEVDTMWNANINEQFSFVNTIASIGSDIYVGGRFTSIGGQPRMNIAKLNNTTGEADTMWNANINEQYGDVNTIASTSTDIYVGGRFTSIGGQPRSCIAKLNSTTGEAVVTWNPNPTTWYNGISTIAVSGSNIYVGGEFTSIGGKPRKNIAKLNNNTGEADLNWNPYANDIVDRIVVSGSDLYIGGHFTTIGDHNRNYFAKVDNITGEPDATWNPNASGPVLTIAVNGSDIYMGGVFNSVGGQRRNCIAKLNNITGELDMTWNANCNGPVIAINVNGPDIYVGGMFTSIGGQPRNYIAKLNKTTGEADLWNPNIQYTPDSWGINTIAVDNTDIYVSGDFEIINGQFRSKIAKLNCSTGAVDTLWNAHLSGSNDFVSYIALSGSDIYVVGYFTTIGGKERNNIAKLNNTTGSADEIWNPNANSVVQSIVVSGPDIYVGGYFTLIGGQERNSIAKLNNTTGLADETWNPNPHLLNIYCDIGTIALSDSDVFVGGAFDSIGGQERNYLAKLNNSTGEADGTWNPDPDNPINKITVNGSDIYVGGGFNSMGGEIHPGFALFTDRILPVENTPLNNSKPSYELSQNYPNPFNPSTTINYALNKSAQVKLTIYSLLGEVVAVPVNEYQSAGEHKVIFSAKNLSSGIYFYELSSDGVRSVRKMSLIK